METKDVTRHNQIIPGNGRIVLRFPVNAGWSGVAEFYRSARMRSINSLSLVLNVMLISRCGRFVSSSDVAAYGVDRFVTNVLVFATTHLLPNSIQKEFSPKRVEEHLNGVLLVYSENRKWTQNIYVDKTEIAG